MFLACPAEPEERDGYRELNNEEEEEEDDDDDDEDEDDEDDEDDEEDDDVDDEDGGDAEEDDDMLGEGVADVIVDDSAPGALDADASMATKPTIRLIPIKLITQFFIFILLHAPPFNFKAALVDTTRNMLDRSARVSLQANCPNNERNGKRNEHQDESTDGPKFALIKVTGERHASRQHKQPECLK